VPVYEFRCLTCETEFEELVRLNDGQDVACPHCGGRSLKRLMSAFASKVKITRLGAPVVRSSGGGSGHG
jgi:putative FmdB family regulatory protein